MPSTRRRPQPATEPAPAAEEAVSDDEAPEEIGLSSGKETAFQQSKEERQVRVAASEERKTRRKAVQERNQQQKRLKARDEEEAQREGGGQEQGDGGAGANEAAAAAAGPDLLPAGVLEALHEERSLAQRQAQLVSLALQRKAEGGGQQQRKRLRLDAVEKGPVTVQLLSAAKRLAVANRKNFRKEQLLGAGAKRSLDMLRPPIMARRGPAAKFT